MEPGNAARIVQETGLAAVVPAAGPAPDPLIASPLALGYPASLAARALGRRRPGDSEAIHFRAQRARRNVQYGSGASFA